MTEMTGSRLRGSLTALVTPFRDGAFDEAAFRKFVRWQIEQGSHGLVPTGTTGESPTLTHAEHDRVVEACIDEAAGKVPVVAGAGSNSTAEAVERSVHAEKAGADALLIVTPYYNKPTQEGLYQHFKAVNDAVGIPILIYNIPGRSVIDIEVSTRSSSEALSKAISRSCGSAVSAWASALPACPVGSKPNFAISDASCARSTTG